MLTEREQKVVSWVRRQKVATMRHMQQQFQVCHMTVFRALKKAGYHRDTRFPRSYQYWTTRCLDEVLLWGLQIDC